MSLFGTRSEFAAAVTRASTAAAAYYDTAAVQMTDEEYDDLLTRIEATRVEHPDWDDHGLTTQVAGGASAGGDVTHPEPMLSLGKTRTLDAVAAFVSAMGSPVVVEPKLDGMAVRAVYEQGRLVLAATRGNGTSGEDITQQVLRGTGVTGLPGSFEEPWSGEVRGEVYMTDADFDASNTARVASRKPAFVNPRNATAGTLRNEDPTYVASLSFAAYDALPLLAADGAALAETDQDSYVARMAVLDQLGFGVAMNLVHGDTAVTTDPAQAVALIGDIETRRAGLGFPIDGAVVKVVSYADRDRVGAQSRAPRWATAYKYAPDTATTRLVGIDVTVGRTGRLGFRFQLDPVFVGGTTVTYATAHNAPWIQQADLRPGDTVFVYRAGDVIPRVTTADLTRRPSNTQPWEPPTECPQCGQPLDTSSLLWRCHTPTCSAAGWLDYWASGDALDIDRIGTSICEALVDTGLAATPADLYDLTVDQWAALPVGETSTGNTRFLGHATAAAIVANLQASKTQPFNRVITGLGIRMTGRSVGRWLAAEFKTMTALRAASVSDIAAIEKLGPVKAQHIVDGLAGLADQIDRLAAHGLTMAVPEPTGDQPLAGKTYVISGSIPGWTRSAAQDRIVALGGKVAGSVSKTTTALITSETATSKAVKAAAVGVPVLDPDGFAALLNQPE